MKTLIITYGKNINDLKETINKNSEVLNNIKDNIIFYVFTDDQKFDLAGENLGRVYLDKFWYLSPTVIAEKTAKIVMEENINNVIVLKNTYSNEIGGLLGTKLDLQFISNVVELKNNEIATRLSYSSNVSSEFELDEKGWIISLENFNSEEVFNKITSKSQVIELKSEGLPKFVRNQILVKEEDEKLKADTLIVVGQGVKSKEDVERIRNFAKEKKYMFGVTRPVAMSNYGKMSEIVGVSGSIYSPKLCVTIGVSGSAAFYVGIENSLKILSINSNKDAPIISMSDVTIVADYKNILDDLLTLI